MKALIIITLNFYALTLLAAEKCKLHSECISGCTVGYEKMMCIKPGCMTSCVHKKDALAIVGQGNCQENPGLECVCVQETCRSKRKRAE